MKNKADIIGKKYEKILSKICYCFKIHSSDDSRFAYLFAAAEGGGNISRKKKTKFTGNIENNTSSLIDIMNSFSFWTHKVGVFVWILHFTLPLFMLQFAHQGHSLMLLTLCESWRGWVGLMANCLSLLYRVVSWRSISWFDITWICHLKLSFGRLPGKRPGFIR